MALFYTFLVSRKIKRISYTHRTPRLSSVYPLCSRSCFPSRTTSQLCTFSSAVFTCTYTTQFHHVSYKAQRSNNKVK